MAKLTKLCFKFTLGCFIILFETFGVKYPIRFCKLDNFVVVNKMFMSMKWASFFIMTICKYFWRHFTGKVFKLNHFIILNKFNMSMKRSSLQNCLVSLFSVGLSLGTNRIVAIIVMTFVTPKATPEHDCSTNEH